MSNPTRIATLADGRKYLVQQLDFRAGKAHVWGEVSSFRGLSTKHIGSKALDLASVKVTEVRLTAALVAELFEQAKRSEEGKALVAQAKATALEAAKIEAGVMAAVREAAPSLFGGK